MPASQTFRQYYQERRYREVLQSPPHCTLAELRRSLRITQFELAQRLEIGQIQISRLERRGDLKLSTLRAYVTGLGGSLELIARLPKRAVQLTLPASSRADRPGSRARREPGTL